MSEKQKETRRTRTTLSSLQKRKHVTTLTDVQQLRLKIQQMIQEKQILRSKTNRMKQVLHDRNKAIDHVFKESTERQTIRTASDSTLAQLRMNADSLENTLEGRREDLRNIIFSDRFAVADELQQEVKVFYLEHKRLISQSHAVTEGEKIVNSERDRVQGILDEQRLNSKALLSLQENVQSVVDKIVSYKKGQVKLENDNIARLVERNKHRLSAKEKEIDLEINNIYKDIEAINQETQQESAREEETINSLMSIIEDQTNKINAQLNKINGVEEEEEEEIGELQETEVTMSSQKDDLTESSQKEVSIDESQKGDEEVMIESSIEEPLSDIHKNETTENEEHKMESFDDENLEDPNTEEIKEEIKDPNTKEIKEETKDEIKDSNTEDNKKEDNEAEEVKESEENKNSLSNPAKKVLAQLNNLSDL